MKWPQETNEKQEVVVEVALMVPAPRNAERWDTVSIRLFGLSSVRPSEKISPTVSMRVEAPGWISIDCCWMGTASSCVQAMTVRRFSFHLHSTTLIIKTPVSHWSPEQATLQPPLLSSHTNWRLSVAGLGERQNMTVVAFIDILT